MSTRDPPLRAAGRRAVGGVYAAYGAGFIDAVAGVPPIAGDTYAAAMSGPPPNRGDAPPAVPPARSGSGGRSAVAPLPVADASGCACTVDLPSPISRLAAGGSGRPRNGGLSTVPAIGWSRAAAAAA